MATQTLSREQIVEAALELRNEDFDSLLKELQHQHLLHHVLRLPRTESDLLRVVAESIAPEETARYDDLRVQCKERLLNQAEEKELENLIKIHEALGVRQVGAIQEIARLRGQTFEQVKAEMGWGVPDVPGEL